MRRKRSLNRILKLTLAVYIPLLFVCAGISGVSVYHIRSQTMTLFRTNLDLYAAEIDSRLESIGYMLLNTLISDPSVETLDNSKDMLGRIVATRNLKKRFSELETAGGGGFNFFLYLDDEQEIVTSTINSDMSYKKHQEILNNIFQLLARGKLQLLTGETTWTIMLLDKKPYLIKLYRYKGRIIGGWVRADTILSVLDVADSKNGFSVLENADGTYLTNGDRLEAVGGIRKINGVFRKSFVITTRFKKADFLVHIIITNWGAYEKAVLLQLVLSALSVLLVAAGMGLLIYTKRSVVQPIKAFSENLRDYSQNPDALNKGTFLELEQANDAFQSLMGQLEDLKIEVYEEQLRRKGVEFDYLQKQIQPHFYLNCLNIIYNMAETGHNEEIQHLSIAVCKYLRAIFRNGMEPAPLEEELELVENYLEIQQIRYGAEFGYSVTLEDGLKEVRIAPLIILTMVENSIKHNMEPEKVLKIAISIRSEKYDGKAYVAIRIEDSGDGFDHSVLEELLKMPDAREKPANGHGVGIYNTVERLQIIYGGKARVRFSNRESGGARVEIMIPR